MACAAFVSCSNDPIEAAANDGGPDRAAPLDDAAATDAPLDRADGGDGGETDAAPEPTLRVHGEATWVFVGDGSLYKAPTDGGLVVFSGATLVGPQTITEVKIVPKPDGGLYTLVSTLVDVETKDVWLPSSSDALEAPEFVTGRVLRGDAGAAGVSVSASSGVSQTDGTGSFGTLYDRTKLASPITVCASEPGDGGLHGALVGVNVPDAGNQFDLPQAIPLDHAFDSTVTVNVLTPPGMDTWLTEVRIVDFAPGAGTVCSVAGPNAIAGSAWQGPQPYPPVVAEALSRTAPFDSFTRYARVELDGYSPALRRQDYWPIPAGATTIDITPPAVPTITSPTVSSTLDAELIVSASSPLTFTWTGIEPNAHVVELWVGEEDPAWGTLNWVVYLSPTRTTFTFFELPAGTAPVREFPKSTSMFVNVGGTTFLPPHVPEGLLFGTRAIYELPDAVPLRFANRHGRFRLE